MALGARAAPDPIEQFQGTLLQVMQEAKALGFEGRARRFDALVEAVFDLERITRRICGRVWSGLDGERRSALREAFKRLSVAMLASEFDGYKGETFRPPEVLSQSEKRRRVRSALVSGDGDSVSIIYTLRKTVRGWRVVDVLFDGISEVQIRRAEFRGVLKRKGLDGLMALLAERTTALAAASP